MTLIRNVFIATLFVLLGLSLNSSAQLGKSSGVFKIVKGDVKIRSGRDKSIMKAEMGTRIYPSDTVITGPDSRAKIEMIDKNELNISPSSEIIIQKYEFEPAKDKKNVLLNVISGKVRSKVNQKYDGQANHFQVVTPSAVAGVRGTDFLTSYSPSTKSSQVVTFQGQVEWGQKGPNNTVVNPVMVKVGQTSQTSSSAPPTQPAPMPASELKKMDSESKADTSSSKQQESSGSSQGSGKSSGGSDSNKNEGDSKADSKSDSKGESKSESANSDSKSDAKSDSKSDSKSESKGSETKSDARAADNNSGKSGNSGSGSANNSSDARRDSSTSSGNSDSNSGGKSGAPSAAAPATSGTATSGTTAAQTPANPDGGGGSGSRGPASIGPGPDTAARPPSPISGPAATMPTGAGSGGLTMIKPADLPSTNTVAPVMPMMPAIPAMPTTAMPNLNNIPKCDFCNQIIQNGSGKANVKIHVITTP